MISFSAIKNVLGLPNPPRILIALTILFWAIAWAVALWWANGEWLVVGAGILILVWIFRGLRK